MENPDETLLESDNENPADLSGLYGTTCDDWSCNKCYGSGSLTEGVLSPCNKITRARNNNPDVGSLERKRVSAAQDRIGSPKLRDPMTTGSQPHTPSSTGDQQRLHPIRMGNQLQAQPITENQQMAQHASVDQHSSDSTTVGQKQAPPPTAKQQRPRFATVDQPKFQHITKSIPSTRPRVPHLDPQGAPPTTGSHFRAQPYPGFQPRAPAMAVNRPRGPPPFVPIGPPPIQPRGPLPFNPRGAPSFDPTAPPPFDPRGPPPFDPRYPLPVQPSGPPSFPPRGPPPVQPRGLPFYQNRQVAPPPPYYNQQAALAGGQQQQQQPDNARQHVPRANQQEQILTKIREPIEEKPGFLEAPGFTHAEQQSGLTITRELEAFYKARELHSKIRSTFIGRLREFERRRAIYQATDPLTITHWEMRSSYNKLFNIMSQMHESYELLAKAKTNLEMTVFDLRVRYPY